jgi:carboxymethylenebutenolidase
MQLTVPSQGKHVPMDVYRPGQPGRHPAVLVLHGSGGLRDMSEYAHWITDHGFVVLVPHYFEATRTYWADAQAISQHALTWGQVISDAISVASQQSYVNAECIALLGFSLGGYLAIGVAAQDRRVKAIVEFFGGLPEPIAPFIRHLPPTLILHGDADRVVPISEGERLRRFCEQRKFCVEMETYPGAGHGFYGPVMKAAAERALRFLDQHLLKRAA